jgi:hypothetical protein
MTKEQRANMDARMKNARRSYKTITRRKDPLYEGIMYGAAVAGFFTFVLMLLSIPA